MAKITKKTNRHKTSALSPNAQVTSTGRAGRRPRWERWESSRPGFLGKQS
jgi:hypothetical protein